MPRKTPPLLGLALTLLRTAHGWKGNALARAAGIAASTVSGYETGDVALPRERLEELARWMGLDAHDVDRGVAAARLVLPANSAPGGPVEPTGEERRVIDKAAARVAGEVAELVRGRLVREVREVKVLEAAREGEALFKRLLPYSSKERREVAEVAPEFQHWGLCVRLCEESTRAAADDPRKALALADFAVFLACRVPGTDAWRARLEGYCTGFVANAHRVGSHLPEAGRAFERAWRLWEAGEDEAEVLSKGRLLDLEASLRRGQRSFPEALALHAQALALARPGERGRFLLNKSATLEEDGQYEASIQVLEDAGQYVDEGSQPRLFLVLRFNIVANLVRLGRATKAAKILPEVRQLAERLRNDLDVIRTLWLEGNIAAGLRERERAEACLEQVRGDFAGREIPYDFALVSLDLALLYREQERFREI
ncbi:MAG TPA: helix-turn-helix domain-containing protein, partial [Thermoanaerobaculia bacterium]|nr:helix-turn-helix domain-containing protein [Thermoanaerobaculia bacterium]